MIDPLWNSKPKAASSKRGTKVPKKVPAAGPKAVVGKGFSVGKGLGAALKAPKAKSPKSGPAAGPAAPAAPRNWWDPAETAARDATLSGAFDDPLKPMSGAAALAYAKALAAAQTAPVMQGYDRQQGIVESRAADQRNRQAAGSASMRDQFVAQIAAQGAAQAAARNQIAGAGQQLAASVDQGAAQAAQSVSADQALRGPGLDGGSAAAAAQAASSAKARGAAGTQIALDSQAAQAQGGNQLLQQISAATAQQGGERQGAINQAENSAIRDLNEGRAKATSDAQGQFVKTLLDLQSTGVQTKLATETLGLNTAKATADSLAKQAQLAQQAKIASLNAKIKVTEGAEQRALRVQLQEATDKQRALDRAARTDTADKNRTSAEKRAAASAAAKDKKKAETDKASGAKLSPQDKQRRALITNVKTSQASGQLADIKKQSKDASQFRTLLAEKLNVKDPFSRQLLADLAYGGLRPPTINAYRARYGRNPPAGWARYKAAKPKGVAADAQASVADALRGVGK